MTDAFQGGAGVASLAAALFFWRFYVATGDRFHQLFCAAFVVFGLNRFLLVAVEDTDEGGVVAYAIRAAAFGLIIAAILHKNREAQ